MSKNLRASAGTIPDAVRYSRIVKLDPSGQLSVIPVDSELSETCFINGIMFFCAADSLPSIVNTIINTHGGIAEKCHAAISTHPTHFLPPTLPNAYIYDLRTSSATTVRLFWPA